MGSRHHSPGSAYVPRLCRQKWVFVCSRDMILDASSIIKNSEFASSCLRSSDTVAED
jgi:hypothetical protein